MISMEDIIMELVVSGGNAKAKALQAIDAAAAGDFKKSEGLINECNIALTGAHRFQTELMQAEINNKEEQKISLILVHGQDHLMNAITIRDLAQKQIDMYKIIYKMKEKDI